MLLETLHYFYFLKFFVSSPLSDFLISQFALNKIWNITAKMRKKKNNQTTNQKKNKTHSEESFKNADVQFTLKFKKITLSDCCPLAFPPSRILNMLAHVMDHWYVCHCIQVTNQTNCVRKECKHHSSGE